jgi:hypothetical protein
VRLFLSHASPDLEVAEQIKLRLEEIPEVQCLLMATEIFPGDDWEQRIRQAAQECDAIACLVTPEYIQRPWFYAEWAAFWFQESKTWFLLMLDTSLEDVFEVMRRRQSAFLDSRRSVQQLLARLANGAVPERPLDLLADELVKSVAEARVRAFRARAESDLARLAVLLRAGEDNISSELVDRLLVADHLDDVVFLAQKPESDGPTKRRQLGVLLVTRGLSSSAARFDEQIKNNAERRTIGYACLERIREQDDEEANSLLEKIYRAVRDPQRRDLRDRATELGLQVNWPEVRPNP